jgi:hypothetical protein
MVAEVGKDGVVDFEGFLKLVTSDRMDLSKNAKAMLSKAKVKKFQKAFHEFDEDNSGEIDAWELKKVLESLGQKPTDEDVEKMICEVVTDDKKAICFDDFLTIMTHPDRALAQVFADRMDALSAEVTSSSPFDVHGIFLSVHLHEGGRWLDCWSFVCAGWCECDNSQDVEIYGCGTQPGTGSSAPC